jgi:hypothetical protein
MFDQAAVLRHPLVRMLLELGELVAALLHSLIADALAAGCC